MEKERAVLQWPHQLARGGCAAGDALKLNIPTKESEEIEYGYSYPLGYPMNIR